jgi:hypothetical protein
MKTVPSLGDNDILMEAADFFTDVILAANVGGYVKELQPDDEHPFSIHKTTEFKRRYVPPNTEHRTELPSY